MLDSQLLEFIQNNIDKVVTDTPKRLVIRFIQNVNDVDIDQFPNISVAISYSIIYKDNKTDYKHPRDFLNSFGDDKYRRVESTVKINVTIKKDMLQITNFENFYFFKDYKSFFKAINDLEIKNEKRKLVILILTKEKRFNSKFLCIIDVNHIDQSLNDVIKEIEYEKYQILNSLYKDRVLKNYLHYPITWIAEEFGEIDDVDYHFHVQVLKTFFSVISNTVLPKNQYVIRGYKTIYFSIDSGHEFSAKSCNIIEELMVFLIDEKRNHDKLLLLRNTMSLYLSSDEGVAGLERNIDEIKKNVEFNFNAYIQNKVELFLDQKNKLLQEYISTTKKIEELTSNLISQIRAVSVSLLGTIFLSLLGDIKKADTKVMVNLVLVSYIFYLTINWFLIFRQKKQKDNLLNNLEEYTTEIGTLGGNLDDSFSYNKLKKRYLENTENTYLKYRIWILIGLSFLILFFVLLYLTNRFNWIPILKDMIKFIIGY